jgi:hypothetical protein
MSAVTEVRQAIDPPAPAPVSARRPAEHWLVLAAAVGVLVLLVAFAVWIKPDPRGFGTHERLGLPACGMLAWTGFPCPGCGVTTSVALAARGHFWASIKNQPFGFLVGIALPLVALWAIVGHFRGRNLYRDVSALRPGRWWIGVALFVAASWLYKIAMVRGWIA